MSRMTSCTPWDRKLLRTVATMLSTERAITAITGLPETLVAYTAGITVWVVFTRFWVIWVAGSISSIMRWPSRLRL